MRTPAEVLALPVESLLPHRGEMVLVARALGPQQDAFVAEVEVDEASPFYDGEGVPAYVGLEYMAQTVGLCVGYEAALKGAAPRPGLLLAARSYAAARDRFALGETLRVEVRRMLETEDGLAVMDCRICATEGGECARGQLTLARLPADFPSLGARP